MLRTVPALLHGRRVGGFAMPLEQAFCRNFASNGGGSQPERMEGSVSSRWNSGSVRVEHGRCAGLACDRSI